MAGATGYNQEPELTSLSTCFFLRADFVCKHHTASMYVRSALRREDGSFGAAHLLEDGRLERAGRTPVRPSGQYNRATAGSWKLEVGHATVKQGEGAQQSAGGGVGTVMAGTGGGEGQQGAGTNCGEGGLPAVRTAALVLIGDELLAGKVRPRPRVYCIRSLIMRLLLYALCIRRCWVFRPVVCNSVSITDLHECWP